MGDKGVKLAEFPFPDPQYYTDKGITTESSLSEESGTNKSEPQSESITTPPKLDLNFLDSDLDHQLLKSLKRALSQMLGSDSYTVLVAALMAVTGRSPGELIKSGTFESSDDPFTVTFSPTGLGAKSTLLTLISADVVIESVQKLRQHPDVQDLLYQTPSYIDDHCQPYVTQAIHAHLSFENLDAMIDFYREHTSDYTVKNESEKSLISDQDQKRLIEIAQQLNLDGKPSQILHGLIEWVQQQLETPSAISSGEPTITRTSSHLDSRNSQLSPAIGLEPMIQETLHHQAQTIALLTQQLALRDPNPTQTDNQDYEPEIPQLQQRITKLIQQNNSYEKQLTQLKNQVDDKEREIHLLKEKVSRFELVRKAVLGEQLELPIDNNNNTTTPKKPQRQQLQLQVKRLVKEGVLVVRPLPKLKKSLMLLPNGTRNILTKLGLLILVC